jgi:ABC-type proline/glycine betaine transport system substrate-binding protein
MTSEHTRIEQAVEQATEWAWEKWSQEHPSLARVIDRTQLTDRTATSLRRSVEFRQAIEAYHRAGCELQLVNRLTELAGAALRNVMGL